MRRTRGKTRGANKLFSKNNNNLILELYEKKISIKYNIQYMYLKAIRITLMFFFVNKFMTTQKILKIN